MTEIRKHIYTGEWDTGHIQGIAVDAKKGFVYHSFTTMLLKTDMLGNIIGSVNGLVGHLGCIDFNPEDGKLYGSLEYKNDSIGKGIFQALGIDGTPLENAFYIAIFDVDGISRMDMDAEADKIMTSVYLPEIVSWYEGEGLYGRPHRYACSGIDGTSFGPYFGCKKDSPTMLMVACGIYKDIDRKDNDNQVILVFDWRKFDAIARPLSQKAPHHSAALSESVCFFYTGNTNWGTQNLCYDRYTGNWFVCVYRGKKAEYPNYSTYVIDGSIAPVEGEIYGLDGETGLNLTAAHVGIIDEKTGIRGFNMPYGETGIHSFGDGYFYFSQPHTIEGEKKKYSSDIRLYKYTGIEPCGFELVE